MARILALIPLLLLALPATASAATTCTFDPEAGDLTVELPAPNDKAILSVERPRIVVKAAGGPVGCGDPAPQVNTVDTIRVSNAAGATGTTVGIVDPSLFAPGVLDEGGGDREIEIAVRLGNLPGAALSIAEADGAQLRLGDPGLGYAAINANAHEFERLPDPDIFAYGVPDGGLLVTGGIGRDDINAQGGAGTGGPLSTPVSVLGGGSTDILLGGSGPDYVNGADGADLIVGFEGDDLIAPGPGDDAVYGGAGTDAVDYRPEAAAVSVDLGIDGAQETRGSGSDLLAEFESVRGTRYADVLRGDAGRNVLHGDTGADMIDGRAGEDVLDGGDDDDSLVVRDGGRDIADCGTEHDTVTADAPGVDALVKCESVLFPSVPPSGGGSAQAAADTLPPAFLGRVRVHRERLRYTLSEAGTIRVAIRRGKRRIRSFEAPAVAGPNRTRLGRLRPGRYRATLLATDAAGNRSEPRRTTFWVGRRGGARQVPTGAGSGRTMTVSATSMTSSAGRSARRACSRTASGLLPW